MENRVGKVRGDQFTSKKCYVEVVRVSDDNRGPGPADKNNPELEEGELEAQTEPAGELLNVKLISGKEDTITGIGGTSQRRDWRNSSIS